MCIVNNLRQPGNDCSGQSLAIDHHHQHHRRLMTRPSRASVITQCDETFKKIASLCDPDFFIPFKDTFKDSSIPEFWQHFRGHLLAAPNGHIIGCASCSVEAVLSANGTIELLCCVPKELDMEMPRKRKNRVVSLLLSGPESVSLLWKSRTRFLLTTMPPLRRRCRRREQQWAANLAMPSSWAAKQVIRDRMEAMPGQPCRTE
jgi:hypothetical protein